MPSIFTFDRTGPGSRRRYSIAHGTRSEEDRAFDALMLPTSIGVLFSNATLAIRRDSFRLQRSTGQGDPTLGLDTRNADRLCRRFDPGLTWSSRIEESMEAAQRVPSAGIQLRDPPITASASPLRLYGCSRSRGIPPHRLSSGGCSAPYSRKTASAHCRVLFSIQFL